ncbi:MAG: S-adenosyl-l-methionine hydroxide adenosyltransferase family protein [Candidatus Thermoplasmatota archaeon]
MGIITFLTDFGFKNNYVSQMKAVALNITNAKIVDICHHVTPQNVSEGAFLLKTAARYFPKGTVHVGVVDPGVGTERKGIVVVTPKHVFVGPDNGLFIPAAREQGSFDVYEIRNPRFMLNKISNTFHGRDIFTPVAAYILEGIPFTEIGPSTKDYIDLNFEKKRVIDDKKIEGEIIHIDSFGNIVTNLTEDDIKNFFSYGSEISVFLGGKRRKICFSKSYDYVDRNDFLATIGSSGFFEISINQGNAAEELSVKAGDHIKIIH